MTAPIYLRHLGRETIWHKGPDGTDRFPRSENLPTKALLHYHQQGVPMWTDPECTKPWKRPEPVTIDPGTPRQCSVLTGRRGGRKRKLKRKPMSERLSTKVLQHICQTGSIGDRRPLCQAWECTAGQMANAVASLRRSGYVDGEQATETGRRELRKRLGRVG